MSRGRTCVDTENVKRYSNQTLVSRKIYDKIYLNKYYKSWEIKLINANKRINKYVSFDIYSKNTFDVIKDVKRRKIKFLLEILRKNSLKVINFIEKNFLRDVQIF